MDEPAIGGVSVASINSWADRQSGRRSASALLDRREQNMSRADRTRRGIDRMQPVLVDREGQIWPVTSPFFWTRPRQPDGNMLDYAVSTLGFIHIWSVDGSSIVVTLRPDLVQPKTMIAAFYAMADLGPVRVFISPTNTAMQQWELFSSVNR